MTPTPPEPPGTPGKPPWESRTVLVNGLIAVVLLGPAVRRAGRSGDWTPVALVALALFNVWLRLDTNQPIIFNGATIGAVVGDDVGTITESSK
jgi:hypothetical protein